MLNIGPVVRTFVGTADDVVKEQQALLLTSPDDDLIKLCVSVSLLTAGKFSDAVELAFQVGQTSGANGHLTELVNKEQAYKEVLEAFVRSRNWVKNASEVPTVSEGHGISLEQYDQIILQLQSELE